MAKILITSGPTRQYLDPVRYLTNASSGRMGRALAQAALDEGHEVVVVSGPVQVDYPPRAEVFSVITTDDMLEVCQRIFPQCDGLIGAAAPCDYQPRRVETQKIAKTGDPLVLHLVETADVVATMGANRLPHQWLVGFEGDAVTEFGEVDGVAGGDVKRWDACTELQRSARNEASSVEADLDLACGVRLLAELPAIG